MEALTVATGEGMPSAGVLDRLEALGHQTIIAFCRRRGRGPGRTSTVGLHASLALLQVLQ